MYRPSKYKAHNSSLKNFATLFNQTKAYPTIQMIGFEQENFSDDGFIVIPEKNKKIYYDWEKRDKYFSNGNFEFSTLGQFERKFHKDPPIGITLQCDQNEKFVLVALHSSFIQKTTVSRTTDTQNEIGGMRITSDFFIFSYSDLSNLKQNLLIWIDEEKSDFLPLF